MVVSLVPPWSFLPGPRYALGSHSAIFLILSGYACVMLGTGEPHNRTNSIVILDKSDFMGKSNFPFFIAIRHANFPQMRKVSFLGWWWHQIKKKEKKVLSRFRE